MNIEIRIPFTHPKVEYSIANDQQGNIQIYPSSQMGQLTTSQITSGPTSPQISFPPSGASTPVKRHSVTSVTSSSNPETTVTKTTERRTSTQRFVEVVPPGGQPQLYQGYYISPSNTNPSITYSSQPSSSTTTVVQHSGGPPRVTTTERQASRVDYNSERFQVTLDVSQYRPEEIEVKVNDNKLTVRAEHKEGSDSAGFVQREYFRQYTLPDDVDIRLVKSYLSDKGILTLEAPKLQPVYGGERVIPIQGPGYSGLSPAGPFVEEVVSDAESARGIRK